MFSLLPMDVTTIGEMVLWVGDISYSKCHLQRLINSTRLLKRSPFEWSLSSWWFNFYPTTSRLLKELRIFYKSVFEGTTFNPTTWKHSLRKRNLDLAQPSPFSECSATIYCSRSLIAYQYSLYIAPGVSLHIYSFFIVHLVHLIIVWLLPYCSYYSLLYFHGGCECITNGDEWSITPATDDNGFQGPSTGRGDEWSITLATNASGFQGPSSEMHGRG